MTRDDQSIFSFWRVVLISGHALTSRAIQEVLRPSPEVEQEQSADDCLEPDCSAFQPQLTLNAGCATQRLRGLIYEVEEAAFQLVAFAA